MFRPGDDISQYIRDNYLDMTDEQMAIACGSTAKAIKNRRQRLGLLKTAKVGETPKVTYPKGLGKLAELLEKSGIDPENIGQVERARVNTWQGFMKDENGEAKVVDLEAASIVLTPSWQEGPKWPVIEPSRPVRIAPHKATREKRALKQCVIVSDVQIGFREDMETRELIPFHDERAMKLCLETIRMSQPELVIIVGDFLDLPAHSKYVQEPAFQRTTQPAIQAAYEYLAQIRAAAPEAEIRFLEGNHDLRLPKHAMLNAMASFGLKRAGRDGHPKEWPVLTLPHLLHLDDLKIEYIDGYPANITWINDRLAVIHGLKLKVSQVVDDERVSVIQGHTHRIAIQHKTRRVRGGTRTSFAATIGCLCRVDGMVPSVKSGADVFGRPVHTAEDWQQGFAVVQYEEGEGLFNLEMVPIHDGVMVFRDTVYRAE